MTTNGSSTDAPVLVAVDFSEESRAALLWAAGQAQLEEAPLLVLHVVHDPAENPGFYSTSDDGTFTPMLDVAENMMQEFLLHTKADHPELPALAAAQTRLVEGLPAGRINEVAENTGARLVVIGNVGRSTLQSMLLGSVADEVLRTCAIPVVIIKAPPGVASE